MTIIRENGSHHRPRGRDTQVLFQVSYGDGGRTAYVRVPPDVASHGELAVLGVARARQLSGEIPAGEIVSAKRVK